MSSGSSDPRHGQARALHPAQQGTSEQGEGDDVPEFLSVHPWEVTMCENVCVNMCVHV